MISGRTSLNTALGPPPVSTTRTPSRIFESDQFASRQIFNAFSPGITSPTSLLHVNTGGFEMPFGFSPSPSSLRPILGSSAWHFASTSPPTITTNTSPTSSGSGSSTFSSVDLAECMGSSPTQRLLSSPTEQEMANITALHYLTCSPHLRHMPAYSPSNIGSSPITSSLWPLRALNADSFCNSPSQSSASHEVVYWNGELPRSYTSNPTYSCKVFLGGVPWDVTEETLVFLFLQFGRIRAQWPGKENLVIQPKGYVYIIFENESQVKMLLQSCTRDVSSGHYENYFFRIFSKKMKFKAIQVIPWRISDSNYVLTPSEKLDPHTTVFVGGLHGMMSADGLYKVMNDLFGGVIYVGIDTDKFKYPIGSARVTFSNKSSYLNAVMAAFVEIKTSKFVKKVQIDPYLEDAVCSNCVVRSGPFFCRELMCLKYFCPACWTQQHQQFVRQHKPLMRTSKHNSTAQSPAPPMRFV